MSLKKERFIKGIILAPDTIALDGIEGEIKVDSATGKIQATLKDGVNPSAAREIVTSSQTQTLTNKTLDVDNNTVSNIETDNLKAGVLNTNTSLTGASNTQVPSALATKTYSDTVGSTAASNLSSHASTSSGVHGVTGTIVGTSDSQALTNKTIDADLNTISNIENADIKVGAAIDATKIANGSVSNAEFQYLDGVTSAIQTQINSKEPSFATLPVSKGGTNSSTALNNNRVVQSSGGAIVEAAAITAARAVISDANGIPTHSAVTSTELGYVSGVTSAIQTQLDAKVDEVGGTFTSGSVITPVRSDVKQDTKANLITYALTATNGQLVFATDTKEMFQVVDATLKAVGGGGGVSDVDSLLIQPFDTSALTDFTQTGLELIETNPLDGTKSARLIHQAASTRSFKQIVAVPPKFRGVNMTASLTIRSSASQGNVTIVFRDETNSIDYPSQQLQTNSQAIASLVTNSTITVSGFSNSNINTLKVGMTVTGSGIPTGTTIASINTTALTITLSQAATASATVSLRFSDLPRTLQLGFNIPANCSSYSYTISALQESGSPETYIDDVVLKNYWLGMSNQGQSTVSLQTANVTAWQQYTPTFQGFGTPSAVEFEWRQVGESVEIRGKWTTGTVTAAEARISLPSGLNSAGTSIIPSIQSVGQFYRNLATTSNGGVVLIEPSVSYMTLGLFTNSNNPITKVTANAAFNSSEQQMLFASVPCAGLTATSTQSFVTTDLVPAKAVFGNSSIDVPNMTAWQGYTPTFQGFGTPSAVEFEWRQVGENVEVRGKFTSGTSTAVEARVGLPAGLTSAGTGLIPSLQIVGKGSYGVAFVSDAVILAEPSVNYLTFGIQNATYGAISKRNGDQFLSTGNNFSFFASVPCAGLSALSTKTIALTQSGLVQEADSLVRLTGANGFGSTNTKIARFTTTDKNIGSDILYQDSATLGSSFTVLTAGQYSISWATDAVAQRTTGLSVNSTQLTTNISSISSTNILSYAAYPGGLGSPVTYTGYFNTGDVIRPHSDGSALASTYNFSIARQGSLKQVSVNSDSKITIPTSELRFEGANTRGSTDSAIVLFNNLARIRGDAFSVVSNAVNGTSITMLKAGRLSVSTSVFYGSTAYTRISRNQAVLTALPVSSEILAASGGVTSPIGGASWTGDVNVGDIIRVSSDVSPTVNAANNLNLSFQEQDIAVSVTNTLPQFSESDSSVRVDTANGYGSTNTAIPRFSNIRTNLGSDVSYLDSASNGSSFIILMPGTYSISYSFSFNSSGTIGISLNSTQLSTAIQSINAQDRLAVEASDTTDRPVNVCWQGYLNAGDVIRPHNQILPASTPTNATFTISKVGKPNVTGVNVTPFVNVPQPESQSAYVFNSSSFSSNATITGTLTRSNGTGIFSYNSSTGIYTMLKRARINASYSHISGSATASTAAIRVNNSYVNYDTTPNNLNLGASSSYTGILEAGETLNFSVETAAAINHYISVTAEATSDQILTAPETFSTDTAALAYSSTYTLATLNTAPVGTYITFTYAINTDTRTQTSTRPTQTDADMNANGLLVYTRAYNAASTAAQPTAIAIQIGKGLKGKSLDLYKSAGKVTSGSLDFIGVSTSVCQGFSFKEYNEVTGILYFDAGNHIGFGTAVTSHLLLFSDNSSQASGYLVINASKSPALTGVPLLQPRIATISHSVASGTQGGGLSSGTYTTRPLNTLVDSTGIVTSLASNQVTLPAGTYYAEGAFQGFQCDQFKCKLRNITDSTDTIIGEATRAGVADASMGVSILKGEFTITSPKVFEVQMRSSVTNATSGFGVATSFGDAEVYSIVKITRIR